MCLCVNLTLRNARQSSDIIVFGFLFFSSAFHQMLERKKVGEKKRALERLFEIVWPAAIRRFTRTDNNHISVSRVSFPFVFACRSRLLPSILLHSLATWLTNIKPYQNFIPFRFTLVLFNHVLLADSIVLVLVDFNQNKNNYISCRFEQWNVRVCAHEHSNNTRRKNIKEISCNWQQMWNPIESNRKRANK